MPAPCTYAASYAWFVIKMLILIKVTLYGKLT